MSCMPMSRNPPLRDACMLMSCPPIHAYKAHACETHAHEMHAHKTHAYEMRAHETHAHKIQVYKMQAHEMHAYKMHAHEMHDHKIVRLGLWGLTHVQPASLPSPR